MTADQFIQDTETLFSSEMLARFDIVLRTRFGALVDALIRARIDEALCHVDDRLGQMEKDAEDAGEALAGDVWDLHVAAAALEVRITDLEADLPTAYTPAPAPRAHTT